MTDDTIRRAHEVLEAAELTPQQREALLAALPEKPQLTLADIGENWGDYYLAEAESTYGTKGALVSMDGAPARIAVPEQGIHSYWGDQIECVTLTGRRYKLVLEDEKPAPQYVETEEEYDALPEGSIVCEDGEGLSYLYLKTINGWSIKDFGLDTIVLGGIKKRVLRYGWGKQRR